MTEYSQYIDGLLKPKVQEPAVVLDLFAGCGGLSLGFEAVGFRTIGFEMVDEAVDTYNRNLKGKCYNQFLEVGFNYPEEENIDINTIASMAKNVNFNRIVPFEEIKNRVI